MMTAMVFLKPESSWFGESGSAAQQVAKGTEKAVRVVGGYLKAALKVGLAATATAAFIITVLVRDD